MTPTCKRLRTAGLAGLMCLAGAANLPAQAEDRSVTIIEGMPEPSPQLNAPDAPPSQTDAPPSTPEPATAAIHTSNGAGLSLDLVPGAVLPVGTDVLFHVATQKQGYLILVDINADRVATQIYPNVMSLAQTKQKQALTNLVKPGVSVSIPDLKNPLGRFTFRTEPPLGRGVIVAMLSERPVQLVDLPELSSALASPQAYVDALDGAVRKLLVSDAKAPGKFAAGDWSLAAVEYVVK